MDVNRRSLQNNNSAFDKPQQQKLIKDMSKDDLHLNLRSRKSLTAITQSESTQKEEVAMDEDFEMAIKENFLEKENFTSETKDQEGEHDSVMTSSEDDEVEINSMDTHSEDDAFITHEEDEPKKENTIFKLEPEIKLEVDECSTAATRASSECSEDGKKEELKQDYSDNDSALGSLKSEDKFPAVETPSFMPGQLVWTFFSQKQWWPCIVINQIKMNGKDLVNVRYFAFKGMRGTFPIKNVVPYCSHEELPKIEASKFKTKTKPKPVNENALEEIKYFTEIANDEDRMEFFLLMVNLQQTRKSRKLELSDLENDLVTDKFEKPLKELIEGLIEFDKKQKEIAANKPPVVKREAKSVGGFMERMIQNIDFVRSSSVESVKSLRHSERVVIKRRLSEMSCTTTETSLDVDAIPKPKKLKIEKEKVPFENIFAFNPKHVKNLFENESTICIECLMDKDSKTFECTKCSNYTHEHCGHRSEPRKTQIVHATGDYELFKEVEEESNISVICNSCYADEKSCFICKKPLSEDPESKSENEDPEPKSENDDPESKSDEKENERIETIDCRQNNCSCSYHLKCLSECYHSSLNNYNIQSDCPQHRCHSCIFNGINKDGTLVKCLKCPSAYHADIFCLPAGSQIISKDKIICPRHTAKNDKMLPLNLNNCSACDLGGSLICCDNCPKAYHEACIPNGLRSDKTIFHCDDCSKGEMPLYNSCVWAKVGIYRWWPGYILTPIDAAKINLGKRHSKRQFCVRFFGSYDHHWTSHERVIICNNDTSTSKLKSVKTVIDKGFSNAIKEMYGMLNMLQDERSRDKVKPKDYKPIRANQYDNPARVKRNYDIEGVCKCSSTDESPCGPGTSCIMQSINVECDKSCPAGEACQNQNMRKRLFVKLKKFQTIGRGFGAKTTVDIKEGQLVIEYIGQIISKDEVQRRFNQKAGENNSDYYIFRMETDLYIDAEPCGNLSRFINHSCNPNCYARKVIVDGIPRVGIFALKDIEAETELTFDYKMSIGAFHCHCGSSNCRGLFGGGDEATKSKKKKKSLENKKKKLTTKKKSKKNESPKKGITSPAVVETNDPFVKMMNSVL